MTKASGGCALQYGRCSQQFQLRSSHLLGWMIIISFHPPNDPRERYDDSLYRCNSETSVLWTPEPNGCLAQAHNEHFTHPHILRVEGGLKPPDLPPFLQRCSDPYNMQCSNKFLPPPSHARMFTTSPATLAELWAALTAKNAFVHNHNSYPSTSHLLPVSTQSKPNLHMTVLQLSGGSYQLASPRV